MCCGTLRLAENISGVHSQQLRLNSNFTPATPCDTSSDTDKVIHSLSTGSQHLSPHALYCISVIQHPQCSMLYLSNNPFFPIAIPTISTIIPSMTQTNTTHQFIQVSAHKDSNNFMHCSNLSLMANQKLSPSMALAELEKMASDYSSNGYTIEWIKNDFDSFDEEYYGYLFGDNV